MTNSDSIIDFSQRRNAIIAQIYKTAKAYDRNPEQINLVAACKTQSNEIVHNAIKAGQSIFGENKVQEGIAHFANPSPNLELRLIGPLQSNKANEAVKLFDYIESLDRINLAKELAKAIQKNGKSPKFLVQVNIGEEAQKSGIMPKELDGFLKILEKEYNLTPVGLMCIPPNLTPPAPYFALLNKMAKNHGLKQLSMGMSGDFETAIKFGATHIRIGTAIFGERL